MEAEDRKWKNMSPQFKTLAAFPTAASSLSPQFIGLKALLHNQLIPILKSCRRLLISQLNKRESQDNHFEPYFTFFYYVLDLIPLLVWNNAHDNSNIDLVF